MISIIQRSIEFKLKLAKQPRVRIELAKLTRSKLLGISFILLYIQTINNSDMNGSEIELIYSFSILTLNKKQLDKLDHQSLPFGKEKVVELFLKDISIIKTSPVKTIKDCLDFANEDSRLMIRKSFWGVPGIYMIKYKFDDRLFYIGRAVNLSVRLRDHFIRSRQYTNRLGRFITAVGWENLSVHILEVCSEEEVEAKENNYIKEYLPTLNGKFSSSYSNQVFRT